MKTWIGLPEEDGGIPVLILIETSNHHFTFIDTLGRKEEPILSIDNPQIHKEVLEQFQQRFYEVDLELVVEICSRAYALLEQNLETWDILQQFLPSPQRLPSLPSLMDVQDIDVSGLMNADKGLCIAIPDKVLLEGLRGIQLVKKNHDKTQESQNIDVLIESVVHTTADLALQNMHREWWVLVMECMGIIHDALQSSHIAQTARVNARYFQIHIGSQIPILKSWTEHFLLRGTAMARISQKHDLFSTKI
jgi:hypothetical protein